MKNEKIILTDIEKEKLLACVELVAKDFEANVMRSKKNLTKLKRRAVDMTAFST